MSDSKKCQQSKQIKRKNIPSGQKSEKCFEERHGHSLVQTIIFEDVSIESMSKSSVAIGLSNGSKVSNVIAMSSKVTCPSRKLPVRYSQSISSDRRKSTNRQMSITVSVQTATDSEEVRRISLPCLRNCSKCSFTPCLGPIRLYVSEHQVTQRKFVKGVCDGYGRMVIPEERKQELRGLVFDNDTHSFYPRPPLELQTSEVKYKRSLFYS